MKARHLLRYSNAFGGGAERQLNSTPATARGRAAWDRITAMMDDPGQGPRKPRAGPIDIHVGVRIRLRRTLLKMTLESLGDALGLSFQQVQKYESGVNRIGSTRLHDLSRVLQVPISYFFDDMPQGMANTYDIGNAGSRETAELVRAYDSIADAVVRRRVFELVTALAGG